jgi:hypothetical protein
MDRRVVYSTGLGRRLARKAPKIAEVYSNANLVLSAAFAADSTKGFLGYRPSVVIPNLGLEPSYSVSKAFLVDGVNEISATMEHIYKGIIDMSPLDSRGYGLPSMVRSDIIASSGHRGHRGGLIAKRLYC